MDLKRKEFLMTFLRVFLVSQIFGVGGTWGGIAIARLSPLLFLILSIILIIYGFVEARLVFKTRAAIRDESFTRAVDYLFAVWRFFSIMLFPVAIGAKLGFMWFMFFKYGYHG